jgi:YesN/AraC family two-component response regulator
MIVDDEAVIRRGLSRSIDWEKYGVTVAGEAGSGVDALEKAQALRPDIIICDIRMPKKNGLWFLGRLLEYLPGTRKIVLSGYSDKEYMMEAIKLDVKNYLLKPAGKEQILKAVLEQRDEILLEREREQQNTQMEHIINENMDIIKTHVLEELLEKGIPAELAAKKIVSCRASLDGPRFALFLAAPKPGREWEMVQGIIGHLDRYSPELITTTGNVIVAILNVREDLPPEEILLLAGQIDGVRDPAFLPCYGEACTLGTLHSLYKSCRGMLARSFWFREPYLFVRANTRFEDVPEQELLCFERVIVQGMQNGNVYALSREIDAMFNLLERVKPDDETFRDIFLGLARSIKMFSENSDVYVRLAERFEKVYAAEDIKELLISALDDDHFQYGNQIKNTLTFIGENCSGNILLADAAEAMHISPGYLTRLLKNKTGRGFNEWLHTIRINKAKELLEKTDLKFYEIAEKVGYSSYKIFSEHFGKIAGCSAREYRDSLPASGAARLQRFRPAAGTPGRVEDTC